MYSKVATALLWTKEKKIFDSYFIPHTKITTKWIINVKGKITKLPECSIGEYLHNLGLEKYFLKEQKIACTVSNETTD